MRGILRLTPVPVTVENSESLPYWSPCVLPLGDRSFAQHVVEVLVEQGVTTLDIISDDSAASMAFLQKIGNGSRFGCHIRQWRCSGNGAVLAKQVEDILIRALQNATSEETVLVAQADCIPMLPKLSARIPGTGIRFVASDSNHDTGWFLTSVGNLESGIPVTEISAVPSSLRCDTVAETLRSQSRVLKGEFAPLVPAPLLGKRMAAGVYVSHGAAVAPSARITGPCWISTGCRIGENVEIGENVVIGENSIVEEGTILQDVIVLPRTYIGEGLECTSAILDGGVMVSARHNTVVHVPDAFLMSSC